MEPNRLATLDALFAAKTGLGTTGGGQAAEQSQRAILK